MRTVEILEEALAVAAALGYRVRHEWLGGAGSGICEFGGGRWLFVDLALTIDEQLDEVSRALRSDPAIHLQRTSNELASLLELRKAA